MTVSLRPRLKKRATQLPTRQCFFLLVVPLFFITPHQSLAVSLEHEWENTNLVVYGTSGIWLDYNRLRFEGILTHEHAANLSLTIMIDNETAYTTEEHGLENDVSLYRAYLEYQGEKHLLLLGRQRIPFGVGRIWNPIDIFNPIVSTSAEPEEREGTDALHYEYSMSELAIIDTTIAEKKAAIRIKGYLGYADLALIGLVDEEMNRTTLGWEAEGEFLDTGIELRSEGGFFFKRGQSEVCLEYILGAEYGFPNSLTLLSEYYYSEETNTERIGFTASYQLTMLTYLSALAIINLDDHSSFFSPSLEYSLSDEMTLSMSYFSYHGGGGDEFGENSDTILFNWFVHF